MISLIRINDIIQYGGICDMYAIFNDITNWITYIIKWFVDDIVNSFNDINNSIIYIINAVHVMISLFDLVTSKIRFNDIIKWFIDIIEYLI